MYRQAAPDAQYLPGEITIDGADVGFRRLILGDQPQPFLPRFDNRCRADDIESQG